MILCNIDNITQCLCRTVLLYDQANTGVDQFIGCNSGPMVYPLLSPWHTHTHQMVRLSIVIHCLTKTTNNNVQSEVSAFNSVFSATAFLPSSIISDHIPFSLDESTVCVIFSHSCYGSTTWKSMDTLYFVGMCLFVYLYQMWV